MDTFTTFNGNIYKVSDIENNQDSMVFSHDLKKKADILKKIPLFSGLSEKQYGELSKIAEEKKVAKYSVLLKQGDKSDTLLILKRGNTKIYKNDKAVADISAIDILGEVGFLTGMPRLISVIAATDCSIIEINRPNFLSLYRSDIFFRNILLRNTVNEIISKPQLYRNIVE
ncbi:MAG: cyclic nucleotide-binding domain-containing protein [Candidatus Latescibacteria bacterium]|nr:cyclic nucleotide-binding domain-containing protein [Candidatus Latescibacterota bacterium]